jgi:hypothetical protein
MGFRQEVVDRACAVCGFTATVVKNWNGDAPNGVIACPGCGKFTLKLRSPVWMTYAYCSGITGPARRIRERGKEVAHGAQVLL